MGTGGKRSYGHEVPVGRVPGGVLVTLPPRAKSLAARRRRNSSLRTEIISNLIYNKEAPSSCTPPYTQDDNF